MQFHPTFWLIGLASVFAFTAASSQHCTGGAQAQTTAQTTTANVIKTSSSPVGVTITGVN